EVVLVVGDEGGPLPPVRGDPADRGELPVVAAGQDQGVVVGGPRDVVVQRELVGVGDAAVADRPRPDDVDDRRGGPEGEPGDRRGRAVVGAPHGPDVAPPVVDVALGPGVQVPDHDVHVHAVAAVRVVDQPALGDVGEDVHV